MPLDTVKVLGLDKTVVTVTVNGKAYSNFLYNIPDRVRIWFYWFDIIDECCLYIGKIDFIGVWTWFESASWK